MLDFDASRPAAVPKDAATVLLLREVDDTPLAPPRRASRRLGGGFEVLMVRRAAASGFMGGAHVFPGGKLDDADAAPELAARTSGRTGDDAARSLGETDATRAVALYVAAIRETFEEAGMLLADLAPSADLAGVRAAKTPFASAVAALSATLRLDALVPQARWVTPRAEQRRYDTRFFLARAPEGQRAEADAHETTREDWLAPEDALARHARGEIVLPPPTLCTIDWLAGHATIDDAMRAAAARVPSIIEPVFAGADPLPTLALPGDPLHPSRERALEGPTRVVLADGVWQRRDP